jgi:hypothetical protein
MTRIATKVAAGLVLGGLMLVPAAGHACEAHAKAAAARSAPQPHAQPAPEKKAPESEAPQRPLDELDQLMAAKCSCGSKADCTCKKGACQCSKCNGRHEPRQVMDALRGRPAELKLQEARYDATAGIFI